MTCIFRMKWLSNTIMTKPKATNRKKLVAYLLRLNLGRSSFSETIKNRASNITDIVRRVTGMFSRQAILCRLFQREICRMCKVEPPYPACQFCVEFGTKMASSANLYRFTHFCKITFGCFFKNCSLGQHPQTPSNIILQWWLLVHSERFCKRYFWTIRPEVKNCF